MGQNAASGRGNPGRDPVQQSLQLSPEGFTVTPPDAYSNNQKLFVPRTALESFNVLGVVGSPLTRRKAKPAPQDQIGLFEEQ